MNCRLAPWILVTLLAGALHGGIARGAEKSASEPRDLLDNRKILEATVAKLAQKAAEREADPDDKSGLTKRGSLQLTLPELWARAESRFPGMQGNRDSVRSARFARDEQKWLRLPSGEVTGFLTWSPRAACVIDPLHPAQCLETTGQLNLQSDSNLTNYLPLYGALLRIDVRVLQPLYTFGKLDAALKLGNVGVELAQAASDASRADLALNVLRSYFGLKAARAALYSIREGQEQIVKWTGQMDKDLESGKTNFTEIDLLRLRVTESAVQVQVIDAERIIASALAALRYLTQDAAADVDEADLAIWQPEEHDLIYYLDAALRYRPELRSLRATGEGARQFKKLRIAELLPDFGLLGTFSYGLATGIEDPQNAFMNRFNYIGAGLGLAVRLGLDFGPKAARLQKAISDVNMFEARKREALGGGALEVERQYNDLHEAQQRLVATEKAERRARGWLQGIKQNIDVGTAESRDMTDALRTYFEQHINVLRAINDVNVQAAVLRRLCGLEVIPK